MQEYEHNLILHKVHQSSLVIPQVEFTTLKRLPHANTLYLSNLSDNLCTADVVITSVSKRTRS